MLIFSEKFVCADRDFCTYTHHVPAPLFRRSFTLKKKPEKAALRITGLGFYELFVNGRRLTRGILAPYISNPDDIVCYDDYDLTPCLTEGENVIGVVLGNGMNNAMTTVWDFKDALFRSAPKLAFYFEAEADGETLSFEADSTRCIESAILFDNLRAGVHYDARLAHDGWTAPGYDDTSWRDPIKAEYPRGRRSLCTATPVTVVEERAPRAVTRSKLVNYQFDNDCQNEYPQSVLPEPLTEDTGYAYDFGVNDTGVFRLTIRNTTPGQRVDIVWTEVMDKDGRVDFGSIAGMHPCGCLQRFVYYCRGGETESFVFPFTYIGGRYAFVSGIREEQAEAEMLTFLVSHSEMPVRGGFSCSDETANALFDMTLRTDLANFIFFPTDCPHREKNGWTGDASVSCEHMMFTFGAEQNYREWLKHIRAAQREDGALPGIVPTSGWGFAWGNGPAWDSVLFMLPYMMYRFRGDTAVIRENAHAMLSYLEFVSRQRDRRGLVRFGLGDWVPTGPRRAHEYQASLAFTNGIVIMNLCRQAKVMFDAVGLGLHAAFAEQLGREMRRDLRAAFLDGATMCVTDHCQSSQALGLYYGLFESGEKDAAFRVLMDLLKEKDNNFDCGFLGLRVLFHVLSDFGQSDLAYHLITKPDFPSYANWLSLGETALPEQFKPDGMDCGSHMHHFLGDINHWFLRQVVGLNPNPHEDDPNEVQITPHFIHALTHAEGFHEVPAGRVSVSWKRVGEERYTLSVQADSGVSVSTVLCEGFVFATDGRSSRPGSFTAEIALRGAVK